MGRTPCCEKRGLNKGKWTAEEDEKLINYIKANGDGSWRSLPKNAGLLRCGKSCRLRWINYLREDVKRGNFTAEEEETIVKLQKTLGNKWSLIASHLPAGRTDNEIKNYWNSHLSRRLYRFRSIGESTMTKEDMIKMMSTSKRRVGRVSREVSKKYKKNVANSQNATSRTRKPEVSSSAVPKLENAKETGSHHLTGVNARSDEMEREKDLNPLNPLERNKDRKSMSTNCSFLSSELFCKEGCPNAFILSPTKGRETEELEPWKEIDENILMNLKQFMEGGVTDKSEEIMINVGKDKENGTIIQKEFECWNLISENGNLHTCSSPIVSYYNEEQLHWDINCDDKEFNLWNEEEEELIIWT